MIPDCAPLRLVVAGFDTAFDRIAADFAAVFGAAGAESDLIAAQPAAADRHGAVAGFERAFDHLEVLPEREFALRQLPYPSDFCGHDPQVRGFAFDRFSAVGLPLAHVERVRHHARARLEFEYFRAQLEIDVRQQIHGHDSGIAEVSFEQIGLHEPDLAGEAFLRRGAGAVFDHVGVVFDAHRARPALRRGDHGAAIARTEVDHIVAGGDFRQVCLLYTSDAADDLL